MILLRVCSLRKARTRSTASPDSDEKIAASKEKMIMGLLNGKTTVVTGAGSGIGKESAKLLAADGATVMLVGRRAAVLDEVAQEITAAGGRAIAVPTQIASRDEVAELVRRVRDEAGPVDILVNNAGSSSKTRNVRWIADEEWHQVIDVNLNAVYLLTQAVLPDMLERGSARSSPSPRWPP
jgi:NADP-dependent 3-hydroxy acid dehydrogenase YdfG